MRTLVVPLLALAGCTADLPPGWEKAGRARVTQSACIQTTTGSAPEYFEVDFGAPETHVDYFGAVFPCEQELEAFHRFADNTLEVLVQPAVLDPSEHPRCSCRYDLGIDVTVSTKPPSAVLYRRHTDSDAPEQVGTILIGG